MTRKPRLPGKLAGIAAALAVLGAVVGCGGGGGATAGVSAPPIPAGQSTAAPDLSRASLPSFVMPEIKGAVSRPNPHLTPGSIVNTSTQSVCNISSHDGHRIPWTTAQQVYVAYGDGSTAQQHKLNLNYLVPADLGGGTDASNIWPVSLRGTGFYQKVATDHVLHDLVCHRTLSLAEAQHDEETNWYAAWLRYVVATGSA
jgi:hypothetical protein